jgi:trans-2-enoyl-CoA reductase
MNCLTNEQVLQSGLEVLSINYTPDDFVVNVWCGGVHKRFDGVIVQTTNGGIKKTMKKIQRCSIVVNKDIWVMILRNLLKPTEEEFDEMYKEKEKGEEWNNWCNDAVIFLCLNSHIFNKGIPFVDLPKEEETKNPL